MSKQQIKIFDTTLRDGQQCPGAGMSFEKNLEYAHLVSAAGIDALEAGFPAASQADFMIVNTIAKEVITSPNSPIIAALCQLRETQIDLTIQALQPAVPLGKARLHTYLPVDPELMLASLGTKIDQKAILNDIYRFIKKAVAEKMEVEFSLEGYSRMGANFDFATDAIRAAIQAGATIINCPDTIGGACKLEGAEYFVAKMQQHVKMMQEEFPHQTITWSAHCHNDFGLALDNTMNAVFFGPARQIEGCFNGVGERAGNVALEQCLMYLKHFGAHNDTGQHFFTQFNTEHLQKISDFIGRHMLIRQPHWPITGENAAKHSSGGHTNAIIRNPLAYQPFDPKEIGNEITLAFGPLSGGNLAKTIINKYGYRCDDKEKAEIAQFIKTYYAERRKGITDQELLQAYLHYRKPIKAETFNYAKTGDSISLQIAGEFLHHANPLIVNCQGKDSALAALHDIAKTYVPNATLENYHSQSTGKGINARSESKITLRDENGRLFTGIGEDQDIEVSALCALIDAVNQAYIYQHYQEGAAA